MSLSEILIDNEEKKIQTRNKELYKKSYPSNPLKIIKELKNLNKDQKIKLLISLIIIFLFGILNNIEILGNPTPKNQCYYDMILEWTKFFNSYYRENDIYRILLTISSSVLIDIVFIITAFYWIFYAIDWRYSIIVFLFYLSRGIMQQILILGYPDLLYFKYPYFPSIVISYVQGSDFFFSGHCGFPIIGMMEFFWVKKYYLAGYCGFVSIFEFFMMVNCREHYTIDLIFGIIFGHYISIVGREWIDNLYEHYDFLNKLKFENKQELKKIGYHLDIGE